MPEIHERVAVLENQQETTAQTLKAIDEKLDALHADMTKYKGFLGGITFVLTCVGTFLSLGKDWLLSHLK